MVVAKVAFHSKLVNWCSIVHSNFFLFSIVSNSHPNMDSATLAPYIIRHFKSNNNDSQMDFFGSLPESMSTLPFIKSSFRGIIVRRVPLIHSLTFSHVLSVYLSFG